MGKPIHINEPDFEGAVLKNPLPAIVDFWAAWCGPCRMIAPILEEIAGEMEGKLAVYKVDVDANQSLAEKFGIQSIPTLLIFKAGQPVKSLVGFMPKEELKKAISEAGVS